MERSVISQALQGQVYKASSLFIKLFMQFRNAVRTITDGNLQSFINKSNTFYPSSKCEFKRGVSIISSDTLIKTIRSRQLTVHTYNEEIVEDIFGKIIDEYYFAFKELLEKLEVEAKKCMD